jgi:hypothetical protein
MMKHFYEQSFTKTSEVKCLEQNKKNFQQKDNKTYQNNNQSFFYQDSNLVIGRLKKQEKNLFTVNLYLQLILVSLRSEPKQS